MNIRFWAGIMTLLAFLFSIAGYGYQNDDVSNQSNPSNIIYEFSAFQYDGNVYIAGGYRTKFRGIKKFSFGDLFAPLSTSQTEYDIEQIPNTFVYRTGNEATIFAVLADAGLSTPWTDLQKDGWIKAGKSSDIVPFGKNREFIEFGNSVWYIALTKVLDLTNSNRKQIDVMKSGDGFNWENVTEKCSWKNETKWETSLNTIILVFHEKLWLLSEESEGNKKRISVWSSFNGLEWEKSSEIEGLYGDSRLQAYVFSDRIAVRGLSSDCGPFDSPPRYLTYASGDGIFWKQSSDNLSKKDIKLAVYDNALWALERDPKGFNGCFLWKSADGRRFKLVSHIPTGSSYVWLVRSGGIMTWIENKLCTSGDGLHWKDLKGNEIKISNKK